MKITNIKQQVKRANRYSIFVDDNYSFSLSESALLESKITSGQEVTPQAIADYKRLSADDKLQATALKYVAMRPRTIWELSFYLERKEASPPLIEQIVNKLSNIGLLDDQKYAEAFVHDRQLLRPTSRRKLIVDLRKKRVPMNIIENVVGSDKQVEHKALDAVIARKRRQAKYQDDQKLLEYLMRQGFNYSDVKSALYDKSVDSD